VGEIIASFGRSDHRQNLRTQGCAILSRFSRKGGGFCIGKNGLTLRKNSALNGSVESHPCKVRKD